jgi:hypothetical protein
MENKSKAKYYNDIAEKHGDKRVHDESLYQWHTMDDLQTELLGLYGSNKIRESRKELIELGIISEHKNPNSNYNFDRTVYFIFYPDIVTKLIKTRSPEKGGRLPGNEGPIPKTTYKDYNKDSKESLSVSAKHKRILKNKKIAKIKKDKKIARPKNKKVKNKFDKKKKCNSLRRYNHTKQDKRFYIFLKKNYNTTDHDVTRTGYAHTMDMIHALFSTRVKAPMMIKAIKPVWSHNEFLKVLDYYIKHHVETKANGEKKRVNVGNFIFVDSKINKNCNNPYSTLLNTYKKMNAEPQEPKTKIGKVIKKIFNDNSVDHNVYDNIAKRIIELNKKYESTISTTSLTQFVYEYLKECNRSSNFKIIYACGDHWFNNFIEEYKKQRAIRFKEKPMKEGFKTFNGF